MNTAHIKKYAPQARKAFIGAVIKKINELGIYSETQISDASEQGTWLVVEGRNFDIKIKRLRERLINRVQHTGFLVLVEHVAYTWFNRLCAIRYMELHDYLGHGVRVLSHPDNENSFEILDHAQDVADDLGLNRDQIIELKLAGNQDELLYRTLLLGQCHQLHQAMPFLFVAIDDETELLLPDNLTRTDSILRGLVNDIPEQDWQQVEIIGWLYQFYISEKKEEVIGKVVKSEDIPAATQLFTPNWIVKYLVQNSVGRQWCQTYPDSSIKAGMDYYIEPAKQTEAVAATLAANTPDSINPESIKVLDPACGSGHILVEAYQVLKAIYQERGYQPRKIPQLILEKNLYGLDIDDRAAQLSGFALMMLARADDKKIFSRDVKLNVLAIQSSKHLNFDNLWQKLDLNKQSKIGTTTSLFDDGQIDLNDIIDDSAYQTLKSLLVLFEYADTFGSLIQIPEELKKSISPLLIQLKGLEQNGDNFQKPAARCLITYIQQAEILAWKYDVVVANPPYMGGKGMNADLKKFAKAYYPDAKSDLFAVFMVRGFSLLKENGFNAQVNMQSWMFLSSYEKCREWLLESKTFITMAHLGARAFSQISGEVVQTTAWVLGKQHIEHYQPVFFRLIEGYEEEKRQALLKQENRFDSTQQDDFKKIPSSPIAYWVSDKVRDIFANSPALGEVADARQGLATADNDRFLRYWHEVAIKQIGFGMANREQAQQSGLKWFPYNKGGQFRKWYGNQEYVVNWQNDGEEIRHFVDDKGKQRSRPQNTEYYFKSSVSWSDVTSSSISFRFFPIGFIYDVKGQSAFINDESMRNKILSYCNNNFILFTSKILNPSLSFQVGNFNQLPFSKKQSIIDEIKIRKLINCSKNDWNTYEISWDYKTNPLVGWVSDRVTCLMITALSRLPIKNGLPMMPPTACVNLCV